MIPRRAVHELVSGPCVGTRALLLLLALGSVGEGVLAQEPSEIASSCEASGGDPARCLAAAVGGYALQGHVSLLASVGSPIPGTASNLGTRVGGGPRLSFFARALTSKWGGPDPGNVLQESSPLVRAIQLGGAAGVFDGFRLMPTVGGFLATDVFIDGTFMSPSEADGFSGSFRSYGLGVRIGVLREGFTVPGVSLSVARRFSGTVGAGDLDAGDDVRFTIDPAVTSVRAAVSKDLFAIELLAGVGWDDFEADATIGVSDGLGSSFQGAGSMAGSRRLFFGSAAMTFSLVLTLALDVGWAEGVGDVPGWSGAFDPGSGSLHGGLSARLVL
ncbi:MAG: hypothetical protein OEN56_14125 [Gemmatimonadota bacterium]|nr:hypothetical protein [Gemmatimonadota bacterium]MDH3423933.1 hypothetical protein [Gemmatimonadota bacterium]